MNLSINDLEVITYGLRLRVDEDVRQDNMGDMAATALTVYHLTIQCETEMDRYDNNTAEFRTLSTELNYLKTTLNICESYDVVHAAVDKERSLYYDYH